MGGWPFATSTIRLQPAASPRAPGGPGDAMWVRLPGGEIAGGFAGWLAVLRAFPRWRLSRGSWRLPSSGGRGQRVYRFVARHRHALLIR